MKLNFDFDFYGQTIREIIISSSGAILTGNKDAEIDLPNHIAPFLSFLPPSEDDEIIYTNDGKIFILPLSRCQIFKHVMKLSLIIMFLFTF